MELKQSFGDVAVRLGYLTPERLAECTRMQEEMRRGDQPVRLLGEIAVEKGYLTKAQVVDVLRQQAKESVKSPIEGYIVLSKIAKGAMGTVYKAVQTSLDRTVALKVLSPKLASNPRLRERFLNEARLVAKLSHPHIIQGYDVGERNGIYYIAMEFVDGPTVGDLLRRGGSLDERRAVNIVAQVARALDYAYGKGIIHRDIKPDNLMLNSEGVAKLCDLGLAGLDAGTGASKTQSRGALGTPHYISPEAAKGDKLDTRSDLYSLGATLYHLVVGEPPFPGGSAVQVIARHLTEPLTPPRQRNPLVSPYVDAVIVKMLEKDPANRYTTPREVLTDLEAILSGQVPSAYRPPEPQRGAPPALRRRRLSVVRRLRRR